MTRDMPPTRKHVLTALAYLSTVGVTQVSQSQLAELTSLSDRSVRRSVSALESDRYIARTPAYDSAGHRDADCYELTQRSAIEALADSIQQEVSP